MRAKATLIVRPSPTYISRKSASLMGTILTLSLVGRPLFNALRDAIGRAAISMLVWGVLGVGCVGAVILMRRLGVKQLLPGTLLLLPGFFVALSLELPEERMHLLEFGSLGFCLCWDSFYSFRGLRRNAPLEELLRTLLISCGIGLLFAVFDEALQSVLPERVADARDVLLNAFSIFWGAALCLLTRSRS